MPNFVKQLDQDEMILQASKNEDLENKPVSLQDFHNFTAGKSSHHEIVQLVSELEAQQNANTTILLSSALLHPEPITCILFLYFMALCFGHC